MATTDLILSFGTLRFATFTERVEAAAAAGFDGIGLSLTAYRRLRANGWSDRDLADLLNDHGLRLSEIEALSGFAARGEAAVPALPGLRYADAELEARAFAMADAFGARHVQVVGTFGTAELEPDVVADFAGLCDRAAEHGLLVALEFVPTTNIADIATAERIVAEAGRANGGLCVDSWHYERGTSDLPALRALRSEHVAMIQIDDGPLLPEDPDYLLDTIHNRGCPGTGEFDLTVFLQAMWDNGVDVPLSVEVLSRDLDALPAHEAALIAARTTREVIEQARSARAPA